MRLRKKDHYPGYHTATLVALLLPATSNAAVAEPVLNSTADPDYPPFSIKIPEDCADGPGTNWRLVERNGD